MNVPRPEPPPERETPPGWGPDGGSGKRRKQIASEYRRAEAWARAEAFWERMDRCPTIEALERDFARERRLQGAAQATVEAFMFSLRERGIEALAEPDNERRLCEFSRDQVAGCIARIDGHRGNYADADRLIVTLAKILKSLE